MIVDVKDGANLKPCPFCGSKVHYTLWKNKWLIGCTNDKCCGDDIYLDTQEEINELIRTIVNYWNDRVEPSIKSNQGYYIDNEGYERCNKCNEHETGLRYFKFCPHCGKKIKMEND